MASTAKCRNTTRLSATAKRKRHFPGQIKDAMDAFLQGYNGMLDSNSLANLEKLEGNFGIISLVSNLIWCFVYGWILSAIISSSLTSKKNIFDDDDI